MEILKQFLGLITNGGPKEMFVGIATVLVIVAFISALLLYLFYRYGDRDRL